MKIFDKKIGIDPDKIKQEIELNPLTTPGLNQIICMGYMPKVSANLDLVMADGSKKKGNSLEGGTPYAYVLSVGKNIDQETTGIKPGCLIYIKMGSRFETIHLNEKKYMLVDLMSIGSGLDASKIEKFL